MPVASNPLPQNVLDSLQNGNVIEAIKLLREATGLGLKEAKDIVDAHQSGRPVSVPQATAGGALPPDVLAAMQRGNKIEAIKLLREQTGMGLKDAKDAVEAAGSHQPRDRMDDISGSESESSSALIWWILILAAVCAAAFFVLRKQG